MALNEDEQIEVDAVAATPARRPRWLLWGVVALLVLGGAGGGAYALMGGNAKADAGKHGKKAEAAERAPEYFLALQPAFVVNYRDNDDMRYLQVGISLMAHDQSALDVVKDADPVVRNALLMLFSRQEYAVLIDPKGKQKLQEEALDEVRRVVRERTGKPGIDALYFTSFVMQ